MTELTRALVRGATIAAVAVMLAAPRLEAQLVPLITGKSVEAPGGPDSVTVTVPACARHSDWRHRSLRYGDVTNSLRQAQAYFSSQGFEVGHSLAYTTSSATTAVYTELASDFLYIGGPLGYSRIGFGGMVVDSKAAKEGEGEAAVEEKKAQSALDTFLAGGGNAVLFLATPFLHYESRAGGCADTRLDLLFVPRVGANIPEINSGAPATTGVMDLAFELQWVAVSVGQTFRFYGTARGGWARGSKEFYAGLGLADDEAKPFRYSRWELGLDIKGTLRISAARMGGGPASLMKGPAVVQVQVIR